ncbi:MAG TPA: SulP family inorganic anion transporter, partial [Gammaproteobacteria bacterium]|nr:SulP family inorganic anion transporter [Gammaproteobacteria bacterium]
GDTLPAMLLSLWQALPGLHWPTLLIGAASLVLLFLIRSRLNGWLRAAGLGPRLADGLAKAGPVVVMITAILLVTGLDLAAGGVPVVGAVPAGLPPLALPPLDLPLAWQLLPAALLISLVGFVESVSVAHTLAAKRRQRIAPDQELVGLGAANLAAAVSGGFPVTGGFARSVVNFDAGAQTPMAGIFTALGIAVVALLFTPLLHNLPHAVLAAIIIVAVLSLVDLAAIRRTWRFSRQDFAAMAATMLGVLLIGVEAGIVLGVSLSLLLFLWRTSRPHMAVVGQLPGSEHFRNVERFAVVESPRVLSLRVDESLYFPNARFLEDRILALVVGRPQLRHLVLMCSGVNLIDASALDSLEAIAERLRDAGIQLHLSEVKGPVMDQLRRSDFLQRFGGLVFVSQYEALRALDPACAEQTARRPARAV